VDRQRLVDIAEHGGLCFTGDPPEVAGADPVLRSPRPLGEVAATVHALCADAAGELLALGTRRRPRARVDVRLAAASLLGFALQELVVDEPATSSQWERAEQPGVWRPWGWHAVLAGENAGNPVVALHRCNDGRWIHLHGGAPHLGARILDALGCEADGVAAAVRRWGSFALEEALATAQTSAAVARSAHEWRHHPQGKLYVTRPAVDVRQIAGGPRRGVRARPRPLSGVRVLDVGFGLAGPTCARTLAGFGADVLQIVDLTRPSVEPFILDTGFGKRSAMLDLRDEGGQARFVELASSADVLCVSLRTGALDELGLGFAELLRINPSLIVVAINCYGSTGPWARRRGWEQLGQVVTGLAAARAGDGRPELAPAAVCDYTTGYLAAYGAMHALARRAVSGGTWRVDASLCQSALWHTKLAATLDARQAPDPLQFKDLLVETPTPYGVLRHVPSPVELGDIAPDWPTGVRALAGDEPTWT
jgi:crotonobetainyl-CoA:carnitine CoA-transferase CaiB-like acyl-CoA transferase